LQNCCAHHVIVLFGGELNADWLLDEGKGLEARAEIEKDGGGEKEGHQPRGDGKPQCIRL
jgi:hypothetical protein